MWMWVEGEGFVRLSNERSCSLVGSELVLNTNEELLPMNRMYGENMVSLDCMCAGLWVGGEGREGVCGVG